MIQTHNNYLDQTQVVGLSPIMRWSGSHTPVITPYPLCVSIGTSTEYGITIGTETEYGISIGTDTEYGITIGTEVC